MSKIKMRCNTCGKWFQSANAKEVTCPDCVQKAKKDKQAAKAVPQQAAPKSPGQGTPGSNNPAHPTALPPKPKPVTSHWFDSIDDVKVSEPDPPQRPKLPPAPSPAPYDTHRGPGGPGNRGSAPYREREEHAPGGSRERSGPGGYQERGPNTAGTYRGPGAYRNAPLSGSIVGGIGHRPRQPMPADGGAQGPARGPRPGPGDHRVEKYNVRSGGKPGAPKKPRSAPAPKPKREKIPPPEPFKPTPEQITLVEERYKDLAIPSEFDGIRSQIAHELTIPKKAVKQIIKALREREHIPSWWETQTYKGDTEEKERILVAYQPYLPVPPVGVHRNIADELDLKPGIVYQAIKTIRQELNLPQYNDPTFHADEFEEIKRKAREAKAIRETALAEAAAAAALEAEQSVTPAEENAGDAEARNIQVAVSSESQPATE
jgi:hypothetical protein